MRSAPCEIRPGENVILQYLSHDGRPAPRRGGAATVRPAATAPSPTAKSLPLAPAGTASNFPWSGKKTATLYRGTAPADPILVHGNRSGELECQIRAQARNSVDTSIGKCSVNAGPGAVQEER